MTSSSELVRSMVMRELEDGLRQDGLWLQAMSESNMDQTRAQQRYITLRCEALQGQVRGELIKQIRGAVASDVGGPSTAPSRSPQALADFLKSQVMVGKKS